MKCVSVPSVNSNYDGFSCFAQMLREAQSNKPVTLDFEEMYWIDANMCAPLGALIHRLEETCTVYVTDPPAKVHKILRKNGFWNSVVENAEGRLPDHWKTTVEYRQFALSEGLLFKSYVRTGWRGKGLPDMTNELRRRIQDNIFELFTNAKAHSRSKAGVFTCGQYFPRMERFDFCIADLGVGIPFNVEHYMGGTWDHADAIEWAMRDRNTTRTGSIPGGLGLKLLREFIVQNRGKLQVVSLRGYWELGHDGVVTTRLLPDPFPGTVVNIEVNTADENSYMLSSELSPSDVL